MTNSCCWSCEKTWVELGVVNFDDRCVHVYNCTRSAVDNA